MDSTRTKFWEPYKQRGRNHFSGTMIVLEIGKIDYQGWEDDWHVMGKTEEENKALGSYFSCLCEVLAESIFCGAVRESPYI